MRHRSFLLNFSASSILYEYKYAEIMICCSIASVSCGPLTSERDCFHKKYILIKKIIVKKFCNAQEVGRVRRTISCYIATAGIEACHHHTQIDHINGGEQRVACHK